MLSIAVLFVFLGFFAWYNTSRRVRFQSPSAVEKWLQNHRKYSKIMAFVCLSVAYFVLTTQHGWGGGVFVWLVLFMTLASLITILNPLQLLNYKHLSGVYLFLLIIEFFI